jgi:hypothetical protein
MKKMARFKTVTSLACGLSLGFFSLSAFAGAWVQPEGESLLITQASWYVSTHKYDREHHLHHAPRYRELQINPYFEYGLTDRTTLGFNAYWLDIDPHKNMEGKSGMADIELYARYLLWSDESQVISTQLLLKVPGDLSNKTNVSNGPKQFDLEWRIQYGIGGRVTYSPENFWFLDLSAGVRKRFETPSDQVRFDWIFGLKTDQEKLWYMIKQQNTLSLHEKKKGIAYYDLYTIEPSILYWVNRNVGLQAGIRHDFWGRNVGAGTSPFIGIWIEV